jgi:long-chain acyl-CoA synthetase
VIVGRGARDAVAADVLTLAELFAWRAGATPAATAYRQFDRAAGAWADFSWSDVGARTRRFEAALAAAVPRGARVASLLPNGVDAVCVDQAALARACVPVPMHALDNPASIAWILSDSGAAVLFVATRAQWAAIAGVGEALPELRFVVVGDPVAAAPVAPATSATPATPGEPGEPRVLAPEEWLALGAAAPPSRRVDGPAPDDLAAIVYTSGTTGRPKGVMLTHANVLSNVEAVLRRVAPGEDDVFLSFLPLSHTFERTVGYYLPIAAGSCVAFSRSVPELMEDLRTIRPTVLVSVPRIYERVYAGMQSRVAASGWRSTALRWAQAVGWRRYQGAPAGRCGAAAARLAWPLFDRLVAADVRAAFGGRLRVAVSGGAALALPISRCLLGFGVPVVQGYGMTETSPVVAANTPQDNDPATVGRPLEGVELRIGDNRELLVRGPGVMRGYWKRAPETAQSFVDGWLRTGDQAALESGRLRILGRVKEIIVTSTGEKIAPADLEQAITADPLFEQAWVFGEGRPYLACAVVLGAAAWAALATSLGLDPAAPASLADRAATQEAMRRIDGLTRAFPRHGQPRKVLLTCEPWTLENTLLTPTLKLKRLNLQARFGAAIDRLYAGHDGVAGGASSGAGGAAPARAEAHPHA